MYINNMQIVTFNCKVFMTTPWSIAVWHGLRVPPKTGVQSCRWMSRPWVASQIRCRQPIASQKLSTNAEQILKFIRELIFVRHRVSIHYAVKNSNTTMQHRRKVDRFRVSASTMRDYTDR